MTSSGNACAAVRSTASMPAKLPSSPHRTEERLRAMLTEHFPFVWRSLRRLGVAPQDAEDAAQEVFLTASKRLDDIEVGRERGFLFVTAMNKAAHLHRTRLRRREVSAEALDDILDRRPTPEELLDGARARQFLYLTLEQLSLELRAVFVLYEIERMTMSEIAEVLEIPAGTVASRLRRARQRFFELAGPIRTAASGGKDE